MLEIDHNFSKAHRIVTTSILPLVEQYGEHSKNVWEASKVRNNTHQTPTSCHGVANKPGTKKLIQFWKQFFEASANVSLSGYEELADETTQAEEETALEESTSDYHTNTNNTTEEEDDEQTRTPQRQHYHDEDKDETSRIEDSILEDLTITGSTPRPPPASSSTQQQQPQFAGFGSAYQELRRELKGEKAVFKDDLPLLSDEEDEYQDKLPITTRIPDMSMTPRSPTSTLHSTTTANNNHNNHKSKDLLLHRVLDKNYRLQATPLKNSMFSPKRVGRGTPQQRKGEEQDEDRTRRALWAESPQSSPEMAVPKLRSDLYMSPRGRLGAGTAAAAAQPPRTPGVSVQTPAKKRDIFAEAKGKGKGRALDEIRWDSDEEEIGYDIDDYEDEDDEDGTTGNVFGGMSPPKTIQFALPASKLMQTPGMFFSSLFSPFFRSRISAFLFWIFGGGEARIVS